MSSDMTYGLVKPLSRMTKQELIDLCVARMQDRVRLRQEMDENSLTFREELSNSNQVLNNFKSENDKLIKDLSIMQSALNDVEEKNRSLNVQILDLRKAMKTMSQFL